jgi:hypothetical protein
MFVGRPPGNYDRLLDYLNYQRTACHFCAFLLKNPMTPTSKDFLSGLTGQRISI